MISDVKNELRNLTIEVITGNERRNTHFYSNNIFLNSSSTLPTLCYILPNHVALERNVKETINDANDRAIRSSSSYFQKAILGVGKVVLITNDAENQV